MKAIIRFRPSSQRGDTLVEVLIAVAVISSILAGAFIVTQKSVTAVRDSQEHGEMTQLLQGQVEQVRSLALQETSDTTGVYITTPKLFCIPQSGPNTGKRLSFNGSADITKIGDMSFYPAECKNMQSFYSVAIYYDPSPTVKAFVFVGIWDRLGGGVNREQFTYRVYPGLAP